MASGGTRWAANRALRRGGIEQQKREQRTSPCQTTTRESESMGFAIVLEITREDFPWVCEKRYRPSLVIATLEALAILVEWAPRGCNKEADLLANGRTELFDPAKRLESLFEDLVFVHSSSSLGQEEKQNVLFRI